jgi:hypothetical protein
VRLAANGELRTIFFSDFPSPNLWQIPYFPKNMQNRPNLTFAVTAAWTLFCIQTNGLLPVRAKIQAGELKAPTTSANASQPAAARQRPSAPAAKRGAAAIPPAAKAATPPTASKPAAPAAAAPTAATAKQPASIDAVTVLRQAREKLTAPGVRSIKARVRERVTIGDRTFRIDGTYLQGSGSDLRLKWEFKVVPEAMQDGLAGSFLEVCDGTILWTRHQIGKEPRITRRDVRQILNASKSGGGPNPLAVELGLGGLPALLASLERSMKFDAVSQQKINGKKFTVLAGSWNEAVLRGYKNLLGQQSLLDHIPDTVRIYLEPEILFPRRIAYLKQRTPHDDIEALVELDFLDIVINARVDEREFDFVPPNGVRPVDVTNEYLQQLRPAGAK